MKPSLLPPFLFVSVVLGGQCSSVTDKVTRQINSPNPSAHNSNASDVQLRVDDLMREEEIKRLYELAHQDVRRESLRLKIADLKNAPPDAGREIRMWVGFGVSYPRCFISKDVEGNQEAFYIAPKVIGDRAVRDVQGETVMARTLLGAPKSGWDEFNRFLERHGIDSSIRLSLDNKNMAEFDGEAVVVEAKVGETYSMVYYSLYTESDDGQKALNICRRIEQEFQVSMGCAVSDAPAQQAVSHSRHPRL